MKSATCARDVRDRDRGRWLQELLDRTIDEAEPTWREIYGSSRFECGDGVVFMCIEPTSMWAYAFPPELYPE